jgi:dTDP-glucose pyrophosphorylase
MFNKKLLIPDDVTIVEAMRRLDETAEKVLLVVDGDTKLLGALTDGDIRRHILIEQELAGTIKNAYNKNPIYIFQDDFDVENIKRLLIDNKIELLPVLAQDRSVVDYITWEMIFGINRGYESRKLNVPVVIMAGGSGTRLEPFTKVLPKPLVPVGEKPVIDHIIDKFRAYGISQFYMTTHHKSRIIRAYFEEKDPEYVIVFAEEDEPRGTASSLKLFAGKLRMPFFVSNCDIIIETDYADLYDFHEKNKYDITLVASFKQFNIPYGICELSSNGSLARIQEKPEYNYLVNTGLYVLNPDVISLIPDNKLFHITHLIEKVKENNGTIGVYPVSERSWIDVGQWSEYRNALKLMEGI